MARNYKALSNRCLAASASQSASEWMRAMFNEIEFSCRAQQEHDEALMELIHLQAARAA